MPAMAALKSMQNHPTGPIASKPAPTVDRVAHLSRARHQTLVGAGLPAMTALKSMQTLRAPSPASRLLQWIVLFTFFVPATKPL
ncbi:hypothetical protein EMIT0P44_480019 [Pseudomonas sp. IT-P44]